MTLSNLARTLLSRWYLTVGGLLITVALCLASLMLIAPVQEVKSSLLLLPPKSAVGLGGNPYLGLGGLKQPVDVLVRALTAQQTVTDVTTQWPGATYTVEPDYLTNGPILVITVDDRDPAAALEVTQHLLALAPSTLDTLQAALGVRETARITSTVIAQDRVPEVVRKTQLRALVLVGAVGVAGTALLVGMIDGLLASRAKRRGEVESPRPTEEEAEASFDYPAEWADEAGVGQREEAEPQPTPSWRGWHDA